jgi:(E)-4-hydroxy-3-methylbut-2-enyl-diphosphate synthase
VIDRVLRASENADLDRILVSAVTPRAHHGARALAAHLADRGRSEIPIVLCFAANSERSPEETMLEAGVDLGASLCDGIGDAIVLGGFSNASTSLDLAYRILQGARLRTTRTEYISCPSCGRTLFDLEETTARIKERTDHLKGVKIAVMGCIVNGPGEMADADFGYVGSGVGTVTLYAGKEIVARSVPEATAPDRLIEVIRAGGRWRDPAPDRQP